MTKLSTGAVIPYGTALPSINSTLDGSLFYKTIDSGEGSAGLYFFGMLPDGESGTFGEQPVLGWVRSISTSIGADTLGGLPASAFQQVNAELSALINQSNTGFYVRTGVGTSAARTFVAGSTRISITNPNGAAGNPILDVVESNLSLANIGGVLPVAKGGTGATSVTPGGIIFGNASAFGSSSVGASGQVLLSGGTGAPTWASQSTLSVGSATTATTAALATAASKLATVRNISITGDGTWSTTFDGSANSTGILSLATVATAGTFGSSSLIPVITVDQKGRVTGVTTSSVSASTANTLATPRNIAVTGDATWSVSFNGSSNVSSDLILTTVNANTGAFGSSSLIPVITVDAKGRVTSVSTAPIATAAIADTANQLTTARTISASGDATWSVNFNGSANVAGTLTLTSVNSNIGSFGSASAIPVINVDAKGRITSVSTQTSIAANTANTATKLTTARTINGVAFDGSANITVTSRTTNAITFTNTGTAAAAAPGTAFDGVLPINVSYLTVGAPSTSGSGAFGTWDIDILGNANSVSNGVYTSGSQTVGGIKTFTSKLLLSSGSATSPGLSFSADGLTNTGLYWIADGSFGFTNSGAYSGKIEAGGNLTMVGNVTAYSDINLKKDLEVIPNALDKVSQLTGYTYTRKDTGRRDTGLIAQDVLNVLPEAVIQGEHLSLAYGNLVGLLVEAVKELRAEVLMLKNNK